MSFVLPRWDASESQYVIDTTPGLKSSSRLAAGLNSSGSTVFLDEDRLHDITVGALHSLIEEGAANKWFTKLPSHEQLMKRHSHRFSSLADMDKNMAFLESILMTPKTLTLVWSLMTVKPEAPKMEFEDSDNEGESEDGLDSEPEVAESDLPPVELKDDVKVTQEEYLLTRLRAARARVEAEQIKMQYFETTGRMPPDSDSEEDDE